MVLIWFCIVKSTSITGTPFHFEPFDISLLVQVLIFWPSILHHIMLAVPVLSNSYSISSSASQIPIEKDVDNGLVYFV